RCRTLALSLADSQASRTDTTRKFANADACTGAGTNADSRACAAAKPRAGTNANSHSGARTDANADPGSCAHACTDARTDAGPHASAYARSHAGADTRTYTDATASGHVERRAAELHCGRQYDVRPAHHVAQRRADRRSVWCFAERCSAAQRNGVVAQRLAFS